MRIDSSEKIEVMKLVSRCNQIQDRVMNMILARTITGNGKRDLDGRSR